ncbi:hypothetical protein ACF065_22180 [Streptomyces sp. NPDC015232]|uniref:hypothetical protein n=1 Tax=unclassified Streptomyces TaxID=2593676 RepID=UPI003701BDA8
MDFVARLTGTYDFPGGSALVNPYAFESRAGGSARALLTRDGELAVYELTALLAGEQAPAARFPLPWPGWRHGVHSVSPDRSFAVLSGQRSVRAVDADGTTRWTYGHGCWDQRVGHPHTGDERQVCPGIESGSCRVSDDGALVWAHVVTPEEYEEAWVVLDARDGRELARLPLDSVASGSGHLSHPDGVHMGLSVGMGQDGVLVYWGRWDGTRLTVHQELNDGLDRILIDVHPGHPGFLTVEHYGNDLQLHALDGTVLAEADAPPAPDEEHPQWDWSCGFLDADAVLATTGVEYADGPEECGTWLLDGRTLEIRGRIAYPDGADPGEVRPLGDGSWLTYDGETGSVRRWTL